MNKLNQHPVDTSKFLYTPMLSIDGYAYYRPVTDGLQAILSRARLVARENQQQLIQQGYQLILDIQGKPKGKQNLNFVIYHVPFEKNQDKSISSFDVPRIDHNKIEHLELVRWTIQAIKETCPDAEIIVCTDQNFGESIADLNPTILIPEVERNRPMYYRARTYNTIIQNKWLSGTTVFLDSDAIVLKDPRNLPKELNFKMSICSKFNAN